MSKIIVDYRNDGYIAYIDSGIRYWDIGRTKAEAIGNLLIAHKDKFALKVEDKADGKQ